MADDDTKQSREEFAEARRALVDKLAAEHGLSHQDFNDVQIKDFDSHAKTLGEQRTAEDRERGAKALGVTPEEFDQIKADRAKGEKKQESTPQSRTANLPGGKSAALPTPPSAGDDGEGKTGVDLIEAQAAEDIAVWQSTGKWPRKANNDFNIE